jgi:hypothetical protein
MEWLALRHPVECIAVVVLLLQNAKELKEFSV